jgi:hypothetical protein
VRDRAADVARLEKEARALAAGPTGGSNGGSSGGGSNGGSSGGGGSNGEGVAIERRLKMAVGALADAKKKVGASVR